MPFGQSSIPIPSPLAHFYAKFPLVTLPAPAEAYQQTPTKPRIWAFGPPPAGHAESLDPLCRAAQAYARFAFGGAETRWLDWDGKESSPEGRVPALHTPTGDLLTGDELDAWIASHLTGKKGQSWRSCPSPLDCPWSRRRCIPYIDTRLLAWTQMLPPNRHTRPTSPWS